MSTSMERITESIVSGIQTAVACVLLAVGIAGHGWILDLKAFLSGWETAASFVLLAFVYTLGILIDRVADLLFIRRLGAFGYLMRWKRFHDNAHSEPDDRMIVL